jgi:hypothetical protein
VALAAVAVLVAGLLRVTPALAKSPPDKLSVTGPGLARPVEITDAPSLAAFDPWTRGFIAWERGLAARPPPLEETYSVAFHLRRLGGDLAVIYVLRYAPDPAGGPGFIHIPGPGTPEYRLNIGTIITGSSDRWDPNGQWQHATAGWDALMRRALGGRLASSAAPGTTSGVASAPTRLPEAGGPSALWVVPATVGLAAGLAGLARRLRRHRPA